MKKTQKANKNIFIQLKQRPMYGFDEYFYQVSLLIEAECYFYLKNNKLNVNINFLKC